MRFIAPIDLPPSIYSDDGKPVYIRVTRLTHQHVGSIRSRSVLTAIRTRQYSPRRSSSTELVPAKNIAPSLADKFCRIGIKIKVNANTQEHMDRFNVIASMTGRTWGGNRWGEAKTATSNPAAVALEVLAGLVHEPGRHGDSEIDLESLGRLYAWCESRQATVAGSGLRPVRLEACGVLTGASRKLDVLRDVLATADAGMYVSEFGKLAFWHDDFRDTPAGLLNPQRIVSMNETRSLSRRADGYAVKFVDRDGDWSERTERVLRPRVEEARGENTFDPFSPAYVTGHYHAMWLARRAMAREVLQPGEITVEVGREGLHYAPGSLLKVSHEGFRIGIGSGEIVENIVANNEIVGIRTMERFDIHGDRDYWVDFHVVDGNRNHVVTRQIRSVGEHTDRLTFSAPIPLGHDAPAMGNIVSVIDGLREGVARVWESKRCVVMDSSPTAKGYRLTLARYDDEVYRTSAVDAIPAYGSRVLPSPPRVYGAVPREPYAPPPPVPRVGANGNWWVGGVDTGIPASGTPGSPGVSPRVGPNGNWWVGETDTGIRAGGRDGEDGRHTAYRFAVGGDASVPPPSYANAHAYWSFDDPENLGADASGNGRHIASMPANGAIPGEGRFGGGIALPAAGIASAAAPITPIAGAFFHQDFTISAWVRPSNIGTQRRIWGTAAAFEANIRNGLLAVGAARPNIPVPVNQWSLIIVKRRGGQFFVRVNGGAEVAFTVANPAAASFLAIGQIASGGATGNSFRGLLDEIALFDRATTDEEDEALFLGLGDWRPEPPPVGDGQFLWMTKAEFRGIEQLSPWSPPVRISGEHGADGASPRVGANGNWWVGGVDTGTPAKGEDGQPGRPPLIFRITAALTANAGFDPIVNAGARVGDLVLNDHAASALQIGRNNTVAPPNVTMSLPAGNLARITFVHRGSAVEGGGGVNREIFAVLVGQHRGPHGSPGRDGLGIDAIPVDAYAYWPCDHMTEPPADSFPLRPLLLDHAGDNHAAVRGGGATIGEGRFGGGLELQGSSASPVTPVTGDFFRRDFTISFWARPAFRTATSNIFGVGFETFINANNGNLGVQLGGAMRLTGFVMPLNQWTHVIVKRRGNAVFWKANNGAEGSLTGLPSTSASFANSLLAIGNLEEGGAAGSGFRGILDEIALFARATTDEEDAALSGIALSALAAYQPPREDVRYRGAAAIADTTNTGVINGERMHIGNFVMFTGVSVGRWQTARLMQWDGFLWHLLPVEANRDKYMLALNDLTHNAPDGVFSTAFIRTLFADMAMINVLDVLCTLRLGTNGAIVSQDFIPGQQGARILSNGDAEFNNAVLRGHVEAASGFFRGHFFAESMEVGPLVLSAATPPTAAQTFAVGTTAIQLRHAFGLGSFATDPSSSSFAGLSLTGITVTSRTENSRTHIEVFFRADVGSTSMAWTEEWWSNQLSGGVWIPVFNQVHRVTLQHPLSVRPSASGMTLRMVGLPVFPAVPAASGTVFRVTVNTPGLEGTSQLYVR